MKIQVTLAAAVTSLAVAFAAARRMPHQSVLVFRHSTKRAAFCKLRAMMVYNNYHERRRWWWRHRADEGRNLGLAQSSLESRQT
jgi:hypothetical protein